MEERAHRQLGAPIGITVSTTTADLPNLPAGQRVYVADGTQSQITVWNTDGTPVTPGCRSDDHRHTGACTLNRMRDAAADAAGNVYVANYESNNILEFTWNGSAWTCASSFGTKGTQEHHRCVQRQRQRCVQEPVRCRDRH